jgi:hypothetical protein
MLSPLESAYMSVLPFAPTGGHARVAALDLLDKEFIFALFPVSPSSRSEAEQAGWSTLLTGLACGVVRNSVGATEAAVGICKTGSTFSNPSSAKQLHHLYRAKTCLKMRWM